ncbi:MAG: hypothetical protein NUV56_00590 [Candidatus Uhrbacteria bacterium]|nr:hypothetical protein [Candidatus Uhrbacteria bacterium]
MAKGNDIEDRAIELRGSKQAPEGMVEVMREAPAASTDVPIAEVDLDLALLDTDKKYGHNTSVIVEGGIRHWPNTITRPDEHIVEQRHEHAYSDLAVKRKQRAERQAKAADERAALENMNKKARAALAK